MAIRQLFCRSCTAEGDRTLLQGLVTPSARAPPLWFSEGCTVPEHGPVHSPLNSAGASCFRAPLFREKTGKGFAEQSGASCTQHVAVYRWPNLKPPYRCPRVGFAAPRWCTEFYFALWEGVTAFIRLRAAMAKTASSAQETRYQKDTITSKR